MGSRHTGDHHGLRARGESYAQRPRETHHGILPTPRDSAQSRTRDPRAPLPRSTGAPSQRATPVMDRCAPLPRPFLSWARSGAMIVRRGANHSPGARGIPSRDSTPAPRPQAGPIIGRPARSRHAEPVCNRRHPHGGTARHHATRARHGLPPHEGPSWPPQARGETYAQRRQESHHGTRPAPRDSARFPSWIAARRYRTRRRWTTDARPAQTSGRAARSFNRPPWTAPQPGGVPSRRDHTPPKPIQDAPGPAAPSAGNPTMGLDPHPRPRTRSRHHAGHRASQPTNVKPLAFPVRNAQARSSAAHASASLRARLLGAATRTAP